MALRLTPAGYQKVLAYQSKQAPPQMGARQRAQVAPTQQSGLDLGLSKAQTALSPLRSAVGMTGETSGLSGILGGAGAGLSLAQAFQNFQKGNTAQGAFGTLGAASQGLRALPTGTSIGGIDASKLSGGLGALGGLASLGYGIANQKGEPTVGQGFGYMQSGLQAGQGLASAAGNTALSAGLGAAAGGAGAIGGLVSGMDALSQASGPYADRQRLYASLQMAGALAAPFTFGLSSLAAPVTQLLIEKGPSWAPDINAMRALTAPGPYSFTRAKAGERSQQALQSLLPQYGAAAQSGDPAQILKAFQASGGEMEKQSLGTAGAHSYNLPTGQEQTTRRPVRSGLNPSVSKELGLLTPEGSPKDWDSMTPDEFQKVIDYFAEDPTRLTVEAGKELGGKGAEFGSIMGSGDVGYADQQRAQTTAHSMANAAKQVLQAQILRTGKGQKVDELRTVLGISQMPPEQLAKLSPEDQAWIQAAKSDPKFDPWTYKNPLEDFQKAGQKIVADKAAADKEYADKKQQRLTELRSGKRTALNIDQTNEPWAKEATQQYLAENPDPWANFRDTR